MTATKPDRSGQGAAALAAAAGALVGLGVGAGLVLLMTPRGPAPASDSATSVRLNDLTHRLDELERARASGEEPVRLTTAGQRAPAGGVDAALVARLVEEQLKGHGLLPQAGAEAPGRDALSAEQALQLLAAIPPSGDRGAVWERIRASGRLDQVLAALERRVAEGPGDPDARVELGLARIQKMLSMPDGPDRAAMGEQIDEAFSQALEIDPSHWQARFRKAEGLSYWPPLSGKSGEAIRHFETLVSQQDAGPFRPEQARTYLYLGNLYERQGQLDKAAAIWAKGAQRHAGDAELQRRLQEVRR